MRIVSLVLTFFVFIGTVAITAGAEEVSRKQGVGFVTASALRLRSGPGTNTKTLDYAYQDEVVVLLGQQGDWYQVSYNLQTGYMHKSYLRTATRENVELGYGRVTGSSVNLRSGPGTGYSVLTRAQQNDRAYIIGINEQWFKVIFNDIIAYIRSDYLDLTEIPYENRDSANSPLFFRGGKSTGTPVSASALKGNATNLAQKIITTGKKYIGVPYVWGGSTPSGFDCSGFTQYVFRQHGIQLPRTSAQQYSVGTWVAKSNLLPGDLVFFNTSGSGVSHLGIYLGNGDFLHASSSKGVMISQLSNSYWAPRYVGAKRVL
jgi:cell wall-associated NlpC family hydrolase